MLHIICSQKGEGVQMYGDVALSVKLNGSWEN